MPTLTYISLALIADILSHLDAGGLLNFNTLSRRKKQSYISTMGKIPSRATVKNSGLGIKQCDTVNKLTS